MRFQQRGEDGGVGPVDAAFRWIAANHLLDRFGDDSEDFVEYAGQPGGDEDAAVRCRDAGQFGDGGLGVGAKMTAKLESSTLAEPSGKGIEAAVPSTTVRSRPLCLITLGDGRPVRPP